MINWVIKWFFFLFFFKRTAFFFWSDRKVAISGGCGFVFFLLLLRPIGGLHRVNSNTWRRVPYLNLNISQTELDGAPPTPTGQLIHLYNQNKKKNVSYVFNSSSFGLGDVWLISAQFSLPSQTPFHFPYNTQVNNVLLLFLFRLGCGIFSVGSHGKWQSRRKGKIIPF